MNFIINWSHFSSKLISVENCQFQLKIACVCTSCLTICLFPKPGENSPPRNGVYTANLWLELLGELNEKKQDF